MYIDGTLAWFRRHRHYDGLLPFKESKRPKNMIQNPGNGKMWACRVKDKRQDKLYCRSKRDKQVRVGNVSDYLPTLQKAMSVSITKTNRFVLPGEIIVVYVRITRSTQVHRVVKLHSSPAMQRMAHTQAPA
jgi:hypothetical protein